ncbi:MAG: hypothetical protein JXQ73_02520 [Phycisphaerae bacterium]|nr:hypothetical protein [Phycisphaerae bacterium]
MNLAGLPRDVKAVMYNLGGWPRSPYWILLKSGFSATGRTWKEALRKARNRAKDGEWSPEWTVSRAAEEHD